MVHKFSKNGKYYLLDVESGSLFEVDECAYALVGEEGLIEDDSLVERFGEEALSESRSELNTLIKSGLLYTEPVVGFDDYEHNRNVKALCLHVAHDCNLRCLYCFAGQGDFKGERSLMPLETAKAAIDFVVRESGARHNIEIDFFGGEPLLNYDVIVKTVEYAREIEKREDVHFHFTVTTNGLLLDKEKRDWLDKNMDNIVLSIDGRKSVNDKMRPMVDGSGSYENIVENIKETAALREGKKDYYVRATYTSENLDFSRDIAHFLDLGLKNLSAEPVVADSRLPYAINEGDVERIVKEYDRLADLRRERDFNFFHFNLDLDGGPCLYKRLSGCGAGIDYLAVTPEGKLYPCHQFVSDPDFELGDVWKGVKNEKVREIFLNTGIEKREACKKCWCRYYCGGGCHANAYQNGNGFEEPYSLGCTLERARVENALALYADGIL